MNKRIRGAALIIVLFIAAILGSISVLLIVKTKQHIERISTAKQFLQAERHLITDLNQLIFLTQTSPYAVMGDSSLSPTKLTNLPENINLAGEPFNYGKSQFTIQDMGGLLYLIPLKRDLLIRYLTSQSWPSDEIYRLIDVLEDWQDNDSFARINGAESFKYNVFGYPLNQQLQAVKELALLANVAPELLNKLANDKNILLFSAGRGVEDYAPDALLPIFNPEFDAELIQKMRDKNRSSGKIIPTTQYSSGNWVIQVNTSYKQAKSSKMIHLLRRFGERRPFVISKWREREK